MAKIMLAAFAALSVIFVLAAKSVDGASLGCLDASGNNVDWFYSYKMPKIKGTTWYSMVSGAALVYQDTKTPGKWKRLTGLINSTDNPVARTIAPIYDKKTNETLLYALYNDQPPPDRESPYNSGHAKGLIIFNSQRGLWLIHSIPGYPSRPHFEGKYEYPSSGHLNGQSILCVSFPISELEKIAKQLYYNNIFVYDKNMPASFLTSSRPYLKMVADPKSTRPSSYSSTLEMTSSDGQTWVVFAKDSKYKKELYTDMVAPYIKAPLVVQGWRNGQGNIESNCTVTYDVMNSNSIHFDKPFELDHDLKFNTTVDHSKWAVSSDETKPWVCVGDINRQYGQYNRGGGTVCRREKLVWQSYLDLVEGIDPCTKTF